MLQLRALDTLGGGNWDWLKANRSESVTASRLRANPESPSRRSNRLKSYLWIRPDARE